MTNTGPWNINKPGPHSPYMMAKDDFTYFRTTRGVPAERLFSRSTLSLWLWIWQRCTGKYEVQRYHHWCPGCENTDSVKVAGGGIIYYNGIVPSSKRFRLQLAKKPVE